MTILLATILSTLVLTQGIKVLHQLYTEKKFTRETLSKTGGLLSTHAGLMTSLTTGIFLIEGLSTLFILSTTLTLVIIRDAIGVRRTVGEEGLILRKLLKKHKIKDEIKVAMGHTPMQVFVGSLLGLIVAILFSIF